jgi:four helix bundle protein
MGKARRLEELEAWRTSRLLCKHIYRLTTVGPFARDFGLRNQIQRASVSVNSNIAEGFASRTNSLFIDYLGRAKASAEEVKSQLYLAVDLDYLNKTEFEKTFDLCDKVACQIFKLVKYLRESKQARSVNNK